MDLGMIMKLKGAWDTFTGNHPKFPLFLQAVGKKGIKEGSILEVSITDPDGTVMNTNLKITATDMELLDTLKSLR